MVDSDLTNKLALERSKQTSKLKLQLGSPLPQHSRLAGCVGLGCPTPRRESLASWHSASLLLTTQPASAWQGEVHWRAATLCPGSESLGLAEPWAGPVVTLFHSATRFCPLLTKQPENTAPSLCMSEVRDVVVFFFFLFPFLHYPPSLSPNRVLRQLRTMLGASQQQRQMAELLDVHRTIPFLPLAF